MEPLTLICSAQAQYQYFYLHVGLKMVFTLNKLNSDEMANEINILNKTKGRVQKKKKKVWKFPYFR